MPGGGGRGGCILIKIMYKVQISLELRLSVDFLELASSHGAWSTILQILNRNPTFIMSSKLPPVTAAKKPDRKPIVRRVITSGSNGSSAAVQLPKVTKLPSAPAVATTTEPPAADPLSTDCAVLIDEPIPAILLVVAEEPPPPQLSAEISTIESPQSPPKPVLTPEEFGARQERNAEFLVACGKYHKGSTSGDLKRASILFDRGVDVDFIDSDGWSALFYAAGEGHLKLVQWLIEDWAATIDMKAPDECTPLWTAAFNGKRDVVSFLLRLGADVSIIGKPTDEPAQSCALAARRNRHPGIGDLIDFEAGQKITDNLRSLLWQCSFLLPYPPCLHYLIPPTKPFTTSFPLPHRSLTPNLTYPCRAEKSRTVEETAPAGKAHGQRRVSGEHARVSSVRSH